LTDGYNSTFLLSHHQLQSPVHVGKVIWLV